LIPQLLITLSQEEMVPKPIESAPDFDLQFANMVDGEILVTWEGDTTKEAILSKHFLSCARARIIGTMVNDVRARVSTITCLTSDIFFFFNDN
jgi:hypothetical protein